MNESGSPAVFLDKDGTLIEDVPYNVELDRIRLLPGVVEGLRRLQSAGFELIAVTNQSGVALGRFVESKLQEVHSELARLLGQGDVQLRGFYYCPHHPDGVIERYRQRCDCRKPNPGLLRRAAQELDLDLKNSWMIGDILNDVEAGRRSGCRTILLDNGGETEWTGGADRRPDFIVREFRQAAEVILRCMSPSL